MWKHMVVKIIYGASAASLSEDLESTVEEAEIFLEAYFSRFKSLGLWLKRMAEIGKAQKWVSLATGRKVFIGESNAKGLSDTNTIARKAANTCVQGLSSEMMKKALIYMDDILERVGGELVAVVHDKISLAL